MIETRDEIPLEELDTRIAPDKYKINREKLAEDYYD